MKQQDKTIRQAIKTHTKVVTKKQLQKLNKQLHKLNTFNKNNKTNKKHM